MIVTDSEYAGEDKVSLGHHKFEISRSKSVAGVTCSSDTFRLCHREDNKSCRFISTSFTSRAESVLHIKRGAVEIARTCTEIVNDTNYVTRRQFIGRHPRVENVA